MIPEFGMECKLKAAQITNYRKKPNTMKGSYNKQVHNQLLQIKSDREGLGGKLCKIMNKNQKHKTT